LYNTNFKLQTYNQYSTAIRLLSKVNHDLALTVLRWGSFCPYSLHFFLPITTKKYTVATMSKVLGVLFCQFWNFFCQSHEFDLSSLFMVSLCCSLITTKKNCIDYYLQEELVYDLHSCLFIFSLILYHYKKSEGGLLTLFFCQMGYLVLGLKGIVCYWSGPILENEAL